MAEETISARDIVPDLYEDESDSDHEDVVDDLNYDLYNLAAFHHHAIRFSGAEAEEGVLHEAAVRVTQLLVKRIFECPIEPSDVGPVAVLPSESSRLPREKKIPEAKAETKWEKFAKDKGITKKKRERMVYDEDTKEFAPRFGYKRAKGGVEDQPVVEVKHGQDPYADPWAEARTEKKKRVDKNLRAQENNILKASGAKIRRQPKDKDQDSSSTPGIPVDMHKKASSGDKNEKSGGSGGAATNSSKNYEKRGKEGLRNALQLVQRSTASMGRYDEMRQGEPVRKMKGLKRTFRDNNMNDQKIMKSQLKIVSDKIDKKARGVTNSLAPYEGIIPDAPSSTFRQTKGAGRQKKAAASWGTASGGSGSRASSGKGKAGGKKGGKR